MSITINQQPLDYTPSNAQHIYNASSTVTGNTDFKYVFDIYMDPFTNPERVARVKVQPNTSGRGIVDVGDIVKNYVKPNTRSFINQVKDNIFNGSTFTNPNGQIPFSAYSIQPSNQGNNNPVYPFLPQVREYRVVVGEEFTQSGVTVVNICNNPAAIPSLWVYDLTTAAVAYPGSPTTVNISLAGAALPDYAPTSLDGFSFIHQTNTGTFVASGTTTAQTGSYTAAVLPNKGDFVTFTERYSLCRYTFQWTLIGGGVEGWVFVSEFCTSCVDDPNIITIWPGVQQNKKIYNYDNSWWGNGNTNGENNHQWWDYYKYEWQTSTNISGDTPAQFLTTFGDEQTPFVFQTQNTLTASTINCRTRSHHIDCPILLAYFFRDFQTIPIGSNTDMFLNGSAGAIPTTNGGNILVASDTHPNASSSFTSTTPDNRIVYQVNTNFRQALFPTGMKGGTYLETTGTTGGQVVFTRRISEGVVFEFYGGECMSDPQHFLFLNQQGVWDTWTFDRKNIKTYNKENSTFAQGILRDNSIYNPLFNQQRNIIFDQTVIEEVEAQSNFVKENDRKVIEELFLSTDVYLMEDFYTFTFNDAAPEEYLKTPHLVPIQITNRSIEEYKDRYNKLFQYSLTYQYNPIQQHRSNL